MPSNPMENVGRGEGGAGWLDGRGIEGRLRASLEPLSWFCRIAGPGRMLVTVRGSTLASLNKRTPLPPPSVR